MLSSSLNLWKIEYAFAVIVAPESTVDCSIAPSAVLVLVREDRGSVFYSCENLFEREKKL